MNVCACLYVHVDHCIALVCTFGNCRDHTLALGSYYESVAIVSVAPRLPHAGTQLCRMMHAMSSSPPCYVKTTKGAVYLSSSVLGHYWQRREAHHF